MNGIEEHFYETAAREVATKQVVQGLMAKAFSECDGDEKKTIARYIKYRVVQLQEQFAAELTQRRAQEQKRKKDEEQRRACQLSPGEGICPHCDTKYRLSDYRKDAPTWCCSFCKQELLRK